MINKQLFCDEEVSECFDIIALQKMIVQHEQNKEETLKIFADIISTVCDYFNPSLTFRDGKLIHVKLFVNSC